MTDESRKPAADGDAVEIFPTKGATTRHELDLPGGKIRYRAIADWITLRKIQKPVAKVFHTAYLADLPEGTPRPLTFVFNGGPGAASAYLHMGALGPKRIAFGKVGTLPQPPTEVVDNEQSWLGFTDLVFIDPIGTGFSRALEDEKGEKEAKKNDGAKSSGSPQDPKENPEFWEIEKDLDALGEFIRRFLSQHHRWMSPLFVAGESYGGFRVAKMARRLQQTHGVGLNGAILISPAIETESLSGTDYDLTYWVELFPSLAAAAHHHGRARHHPEGATLETVLEDAQAFARNDLSRWLAQGDALGDDERSLLIKTMADLIGLPESTVTRSGGRIASTVFCRQLLREERRLCGHYDASITSVDPFPDRDQYEGPDPTLFSIDRLYASAVNHHLRSNLELDTELDYRLLSMEVNAAWKDRSRDHVFRKLTGAMDDLRYGMSLNEHMKVLIAHGYYDLVTPFFGSERLIAHMKLTPSQRRNLVTRHFRGGHMFYSWDESRQAFLRETERFYASALPGGGAAIA